MLGQKGMGAAIVDGRDEDVPVAEVFFFSTYSSNSSQTWFWIDGYDIPYWLLSIYNMPFNKEIHFIKGIVSKNRSQDIIRVYTLVQFNSLYNEMSLCT